MRIATITNWAYGATVCLTIASGIIMLMASSADTLERQAVEQRQKFDQLTEDIETDIWAQSDLARLYAIKKDPQVLKEYNQAENSLKRIELRLEKLQDNGASDEELALLHEGIKIVDELQDEQQTALASLERGEDAQAVALLYGQPYEQELERAQNQLDHFRQILDKRVIAAVQEATKKIESAAYRLRADGRPDRPAVPVCARLYIKTPRAAPRGPPERRGAPPGIPGLRG